MMRRLLGRLREHALLVVLIAAAPAVVCAQSAGWPSERPPRPLDAHPVSFPHYELRTLPNGLQVIVVRQNEQPVVSVRMLVRAGSAQDPTNKPGVAEMVATLLDQGTATRSAAEIADTIDFMGGGLSIGAGTDLSFANTILLQSKLDEGLQLNTGELGYVGADRLTGKRGTLHIANLAPATCRTRVGTLHGSRI
jgi:zinc protease